MGGNKQNSSRTTHVSVRIDNDVLAEVDRLSAAQEIPVKRAAVINALLREGVERHRRKRGR